MQNKTAHEFTANIENPPYTFIQSIKIVEF